MASHDMYIFYLFCMQEKHQDFYCFEGKASYKASFESITFQCHTVPFCVLIVRNLVSVPYSFPSFKVLKLLIPSSV